MKQLQWMGKWERQRPQALGVGGRAQQQRGPRESKQEHVVRLGSWGVEGGEEGRRPGPALILKASAPQGASFQEGRRWCFLVMTLSSTESHDEKRYSHFQFSFTP